MAVPEKVPVTSVEVRFAVSEALRPPSSRSGFGEEKPRSKDWPRISVRSFNCAEELSVGQISIPPVGVHDLTQQPGADDAARPPDFGNLSNVQIIAIFL